MNETFLYHATWIKIVNCFKELINISNSTVHKIAGKCRKRKYLASTRRNHLKMICYAPFRKGETTSFFVFNYEEILYLDPRIGVSTYNTYSMYQFRLRCNVGLNCRNRYPPARKETVRNEFPSIDFRPRGTQGGIDVLARTSVCGSLSNCTRSASLPRYVIGNW